MRSNEKLLTIHNKDIDLEKIFMKIFMEEMGKDFHENSENLIKYLGSEIFSS